MPMTEREMPGAGFRGESGWMQDFFIFVLNIFLSALVQMALAYSLIPSAHCYLYK